MVIVPRVVEKSKLTMSDVFDEFLNRSKKGTVRQWTCPGRKRLKPEEHFLSLLDH